MVGDRVKHSLSPLLHNAVAISKDLPFSYQRTAILPGAFKEWALSERSHFLDAFSVTVPFKEDAYEICAALSQSATICKSVNCMIRREDGSYVGHNTDWHGFEEALYHHFDARFDFKLPVAVLGSGGVARTAVLVLADLGFKEIYLRSRKQEKAESFCESLDGALKELGDAKLVPCTTLPKREFALCVNATPLGFNKEDPLALSEEEILRSAYIFDMVYKQRGETALVTRARELGTQAASGKEMLVYQAAAALIFWHEAIGLYGLLNYEEICGYMFEAMDAAPKRRHVALIGYMGSGKSRQGRSLARDYNLPFKDIDELVVKKAGKSIAEIFATDGEEAFRDLESKALLEALEQDEPSIISCGGGLPLRAQNRKALQLHALTFYLDVGADELKARLKRSIERKGSSRPLHADGQSLLELESKLESRQIYYEQCSDRIIEVKAGENAATVLHKIKEEL